MALGPLDDTDFQGGPLSPGSLGGSQPNTIFSDGFEDGTRKWDTATGVFETSTDRVYEGDQSVLADLQDADPAVASFAGHIYSSVSFAFYDENSSNSSGCGVRLRNSDDDVECSLMSNNPQWDVEDGSGVTEIHPGVGDTWTVVSASFDWGAGTFDVAFEAQDAQSTTATHTGPLINGVDIASVEISQYSGGSFDTAAMRSWFDAFEVVAPEDSEPPTAPSALIATPDGISILADWDAATDDVGVDHYAIQYTGGGASGEARTPTSATSGVASGLDQQTAYDVSVVAVDLSGNRGPPSASTTVTTGTAAGSLDYFEGYEPGSFPSAYTKAADENVFVDDSRSVSLGQSLRFDETDSVNANGQFRAWASGGFAAAGGNGETELTMAYQEPSNSSGQALRWLDSSGNEIVAAGTGNPEPAIYGGNGLIVNATEPNPNYGAWRRFTVTVDWGASTADVSWEDLEGSTAGWSVTEIPFVDSGASDVAAVEMGSDRRGESPGRGGVKIIGNFDDVSFNPTG